MKNLILFFSLFLIIGCESTETSKYQLKTDPLIQQNFEDTEIVALQKVMDFFETSICKIEGISVSETEDCLIQYLAKMKKGANNGLFEMEIPVAEQKTLYESIDKIAFQAIWSESSVSSKTDTLPIYLPINTKYFGFLKTLSNDHPKLNDYTKSLKAVGDFGPSAIGHVLNDYEMYDLSDPKLRLFFAIHYLTLNYNYGQHKELRARELQSE